MKKILVVFALFAALILVVSCGGGSSKSDKTNDSTDTGETVTDDDAADSDEPAGDTDDGGDSSSDAGDSTDTTPDGGDSASDNGDSQPDSGDSQPDNDADSDSGDTAPDQDTDADMDTDPVVPSMEEGIYLGIIGFNNDLTKKPIKRLTDANKSEFKSFINSLTQLNLTALYWADYSALDMMENFEISPDLQLKKVALVTFTDGLDNQSLSSDDFNPGPYDSHAEYLDAIHSMIMDEDGIHGQPVTAYSIGLKGADVTDEDKFVNTLEMLATEESGDEKYFFRVSDMNEVGQLFADIAASLYSVSTTINVGVYIPGGYDNGQVIRYTFDNVSAATSSNLYIEATYHRSGSSRTLENIKYEGFIPGASTISSSATGPNNELYFQFNDLKYSNGDPVLQSEIISKSRLWKQTSSGAWDGETEMNMAELPPIIDEDKSSALIMLVLDSTTSLGSDFARMQNEAKNFVEILVNGGSGVPESSPCDDNPCATLANSTHICTVSDSDYVCGCVSGYNWNGTQCLDTAAEECASVGGTWNSSTGKCTRTQSCSSKPANTVWNTVSSITQTYDGSSWSPSATSSFNKTGSTSQCRYKCATNYEWNGSTCVYSIPECSTSNTGPCYDSTSHLTWSKKADTTYNWSGAGTYCDGLSEGGYTDWRLPNISELRTLIKNCTGTQMPGGSCGLIDTGNSSTSCLSSSCCTESACYSCFYDSTGGHSKFGETGWFWSSSTRSDSTDGAWGVGFGSGYVGNGIKTINSYYVRCVR